MSSRDILAKPVSFYADGRHALTDALFFRHCIFANHLNGCFGIINIFCSAFLSIKNIEFLN